MYKHILLPTDGSDQDREAIIHGVALAKALGASVTGLHVIVESTVAAGIGKSLRPATKGKGRLANTWMCCDQGSDVGRGAARLLFREELIGG